MQSKQEAVQHWLSLADELDRAAANGITPHIVAEYNARLYRRTAESVERNVCACCFKPFTRGSFSLL